VAAFKTAIDGIGELKAQDEQRSRDADDEQTHPQGSHLSVGVEVEYANNQDQSQQEQGCRLNDPRGRSAECA
jgi:hypothetical protein